MSKPVSLGLIGSGFMALTYAEAIARHCRGARLAAVAGGRRTPALAAEYGIAAVPDVDALLERDDIDAVIVTTPDQVHCEHTLRAASSKKHVLVEKPMAPTVAQCDRMIAACREAGVKLAVVKTERYRTLCRKAKQLVESGAIGGICMMRTASCYSQEMGRFLLESRPFYADPQGGGLFMSIASHNADFLLWLCGQPATQIYARGRTYSDLSAPGQSFMAQISFAGGIMAHLWISSEFPAPSLPSSDVRFQVIGTQGMLDFENYEYLDVAREGKWERVFVPPRFDYLKEPKSAIRLEPHIGVVQEFVDSIAQNRPPAVGGAEGRAAVEICEACARSAATQRAVDLPLGPPLA